jgi:RNA polymerase sigma factor (sigma-70 family)
MHDTADVVQDAAIRVWRRLDHIRVERPGDLDAYLRQAARNRIRDEARRIGRRPELTSLDVEPADGSPSPLDAVIADELLARDAGTWGRLTPEDRELLVARFQFGYSYEEVARLMARPSAAAARMAVNRVVARLRDLIVERDAARRASRVASH